MVHAPIRTKGAASRLTENWVGPFRVLKCNGHKNYTLRHIDCDREVHQTVSNMCVAPEELFEKEYDERYNATRSLATPGRRHGVGAHAQGRRSGASVVLPG